MIKALVQHIDWYWMDQQGYWVISDHHGLEWQILFKRALGERSWRISRRHLGHAIRVSPKSLPDTLKLLGVREDLFIEALKSDLLVQVAHAGKIRREAARLLGETAIEAADEGLETFERELTKAIGNIFGEDPKPRAALKLIAKD